MEPLIKREHDTQAIATPLVYQGETNPVYRHGEIYYVNPMLVVQREWRHPKPEEYR